MTNELKVAAWLRIKPTALGDDWDEYDFSANKQPGFNCPLVKQDDALMLMAEQEAEIAALKAELADAKEDLEYFRHWNEGRFKRLWRWAHEKLSEDLKTEYFNIVANGSANVNESPVHRRMMSEAELRLDAERYRFLRAQPIEGEAGQPVIAMPNGISSGYYLNEETADFAVDAAMAQAVQSPPAGAYCAKLAGPCPDRCPAIKVACDDTLQGDCWRVKPPHFEMPPTDKQVRDMILAHAVPGKALWPNPRVAESKASAQAVQPDLLDQTHFTLDDEGFRAFEAALGKAVKPEGTAS